MQNKIEYTYKQKSTVKVGQFYRDEDLQQLYIVAEVRPPGHYALISLTDGISWTEFCDKIDDIFDDYKDNFTLIADPFTVTPNY